MKEQTSYATIDADIKMLKDSKYDAIITRYSEPMELIFYSGPVRTHAAHDEKAKAG